MKNLLLAISLVALTFQNLLASSNQTTEAEFAALKKAFSELRPQTGTIPIKNSLATLHVPEGLQYLDEKDARWLLVKAWGNPPDSADNVLGMLVTSPQDAVSETGWGIIITYTEDGHVDDADALKINYSTLLKQMQEGTLEANKERTKQGYSTMRLVGWAEPPHYDPATHKIFWAKELAFEGNPQNTLNYCTRILGRRGVLELNAVASINALPAIREQAQKAIAQIDFNEGNRYADYNQSTDKLATYGVAALVAGGIAGKMGIFKVILGVLLAAKKFVIIGAIALASGLKKFFGRKNE